MRQSVSGGIYNIASSRDATRGGGRRGRPTRVLTVAAATAAAAVAARLVAVGSLLATLAVYVLREEGLLIEFVGVEGRL